MRILVTSDLHFNIARSRPSCLELAERVNAARADALVLVGDTAGSNLADLEAGLSLFAPFQGRKLMVPGNHCLWTTGGGSSLDRYERVLPEAARRHGFAMLDEAPAMLGGVALAGSVGWYDYSFRDVSLGIPLEFYRQKVAPGAARYLGLQELVDAHRHELSEQQMAMGSRWMDGQHVRLGMSDERFVELLCEKLARQLDELEKQAAEIIVFVHHLPFRELLPGGPSEPHRQSVAGGGVVETPPGRRSLPADKLAFVMAYMGSERLGKVLLSHPKVRRVYCGHSHWHKEAQVGGIRAVSIGSTYVHKHLEVVDV